MTYTFTLTWKTDTHSHTHKQTPIYTHTQTHKYMQIYIICIHKLSQQIMLTERWERCDFYCWLDGLVWIVLWDIVCVFLSSGCNQTYKTRDYQMLLRCAFTFSTNTHTQNQKRSKLHRKRVECAVPSVVRSTLNWMGLQKLGEYLYTKFSLYIGVWVCTNRIEVCSICRAKMKALFSDTNNASCPKNVRCIYMQVTIDDSHSYSAHSAP